MNQSGVKSYFRLKEFTTVVLKVELRGKTPTPIERLCFSSLSFSVDKQVYVFSNWTSESLKERNIDLKVVKPKMHTQFDHSPQCAGVQLISTPFSQNINYIRVFNFL